MTLQIRVSLVIYHRQQLGMNLGALYPWPVCRPRHARSVWHVPSRPFPRWRDCSARVRTLRLVGASKGLLRTPLCRMQNLHISC